jgi:hypothetical protein
MMPETEQLTSTQLLLLYGSHTDGCCGVQTDRLCSCGWLALRKKLITGVDMKGWHDRLQSLENEVDLLRARLVRAERRIRGSAGSTGV